MNEQSHYKQDKNKTRQCINVKSHIFKVRGDNDKSKQTPTRMSSVQLSRPHNCKKEKVTLPDGFAEFLKIQDPPEYWFPWGYRDIAVTQAFWLGLACTHQKTASCMTVLSRKLPLTVKDPLQTALAYRERILEYFWRHKIEAKSSVLLVEDYIPFEIQIEIMKRLPVKSLLQFRTVSNSWKSCIDSATFFFNYGVRKSINDVFYLTYNHGFQGSMISVEENLIHTLVFRNLVIANLKLIATSQGI
ncbi:F-box domain containing protein [Tanacetum coccineum]